MIRDSVFRARAASVSLGALLSLSACGAPASEPAQGPVAEDVRASLESGTQSFDHGGLDVLLAGGVHDGFVDYVFFQERAADLDAYLASFAEIDAASLAPDHLKALLINAYNALTIRTILDNPGVSTIRDIDGVWTERRHRVAGHDLTLDEIEHNLLRPFFTDPRIHFALNCASRSCAPLPVWAFDGDMLDAQLEERTRLFLSDPANVRIEDGQLVLSRYFDWFGDDFVTVGWTPRAETIPDFVADYAAPDVAARITSGEAVGVRFMDYDWSLNDARPAAESTSSDTDDAGRSPGAVTTDTPAEADWVTRLRRWVHGFGPAAPLVYGLVYVLGVVLFLPGSPLTIGAGIAFGLVGGTILVSAASTIGASAAFLIARYLMRGRVEGWIEGREKFTAVDRAVGAQGWRIVALTRLSPAFPFNLQNYAYGVTKVRFGPYALTSWLAMLPGTLLYVSIGAAGAELVSAASGGAGWGQTTLRVLGLVATLAVVVLVTRAVRRELRAVTAGAGGQAAGGLERPAADPGGVVGDASRPVAS